MKLIGNLKKQVEKANSREEAKDLIKNAGMMLTDDELEMVAGGLEIETKDSIVHNVVIVPGHGPLK